MTFTPLTPIPANRPPPGASRRGRARGWAGAVLAHSGLLGAAWSCRAASMTDGAGQPGLASLFGAGWGLSLRAATVLLM